MALGGSGMTRDSSETTLDSGETPHGSAMTLDHVFVFADDPERTIAQLRAEGLTETYRRVHTGQGTANACFCFENAYLEILWVTDAAACGSPPIARTRLLERSRASTHGTCPIGIAWREDASALENVGAHAGASAKVDAQAGARAAARAEVPVWQYAPPYLPPGVTIPVAVESDDPNGPMLFQSPGTAAPATWPEARRGTLQRTAGMSAIERVIVRVPTRGTVGPALRALAPSLSLTLQAAETEGWGITLVVGTTAGTSHAITVL
jgi:hypothetical protein